MGGELETADSTARLRAEVSATYPLRRIEVVRDGAITVVRHVDECSATLDEEVSLNDRSCSSVYVRCVRADNCLAWSSPISVFRKR